MHEGLCLAPHAKKDRRDAIDCPGCESAAVAITACKASSVREVQVAGTFDV